MDMNDSELAFSTTSRRGSLPSASFSKVKVKQACEELSAKRKLTQSDSSSKTDKVLST